MSPSKPGDGSTAAAAVPPMQNLEDAAAAGPDGGDAVPGGNGVTEADSVDSASTK